MKNYLIMVSETTPLTLKGNDSDDHLRRLKSYQWCVVRNLGLFVLHMINDICETSSNDMIL